MPTDGKHQGEDARTLALLAHQGLQHHQEECERRYTHITAQLTSINKTISSESSALHTRISMMDKRYAGKAWAIAISMILGLLSMCGLLLGYIWETRV